MKKEREGRGERDWREEGERGNGRKKNVGKGMEGQKGRSIPLKIYR